MFPEFTWYEVKDGDKRALALMRRHYSWRGRLNYIGTTFAGPGEKMVLLTPQCDALFIWRLERFRRDDQQGINCAVFRNESEYKSSFLIEKAQEIALERWPGQRLYTFVNPDKIKSTNPGYCFKLAGWKVCGKSKGGLIILEYMPTLAQSR